MNLSDMPGKEMEKHCLKSRLKTLIIVTRTLTWVVNSQHT